MPGYVVDFGHDKKKRQSKKLPLFENIFLTFGLLYVILSHVSFGRLGLVPIQIYVTVAGGLSTGIFKTCICRFHQNQIPQFQQSDFRFRA